ncbi:OmpA family protein [Vibrio sp. SBT000027]|uniref:OmpA family protein n=1 Tax=Vibrio sp. SBT000027 TaxID=1803384 RepID=UPI001600DF39|nr:OmpA family protein [Vibrio sp. SBT000027]
MKINYSFRDETFLSRLFKMKVKISQLKTLFYIQLAVVVLVSYDCFAASSSEEGDVYPHSFIGTHVEYANPSTSRMPDQSALGVLIGSQFTENWSWDIGYIYFGDTGVSEQDSEAGLFESAVRYDWYFQRDTSVYTRVGAAYWTIESNQTVDSIVVDDKYSGFSPVGELGINYRWNRHVYLNAGYKYTHDIGDSDLQHYDNHALLAGITYHFKGKEQLRQKIVEEIAPKVADKPVKIFETVLKEVNFEFNSDQMIETKESSGAIREIAQLLKQHANAHVEVVGHTDSWGTDQYNETLSLKRAQTVSRQLELKGIKASRITATGMGEALPLVDNRTPENRALNRRVEIIISSFEYF